MSSILSEEDDYSKYSAFDEEGGSTTIGDSTAFAVQSKTATGSMSLADVKFDSERVKRRSKQQREYSRDEFLYALSSPCAIGVMAWIVSSFVSVIHGSSIVVYLNFCIPLLLGPYVVKEQMPAQLLPSVRRKFNKLRSEANALAIKNVQLKGTLSRMQRQEYRLSAAEERFENLCKRNEKDIVKMKQLARKNAALGQTIKKNLAGKKLEESLTNMLTVDTNGKNLISEMQIREVVILMKAFAGKNTPSKFDKDTIHRAVINSMTKNRKTAFVSSIESDTETRDSEGDYEVRKMYNTSKGERTYSDANSKVDKDAIHRAANNSMTKNRETAFVSSIESDTETRDSEADYDERKMYNVKEAECAYSSEEETEGTDSIMDIDSKPSQQSHTVKPDDDTHGEKSWALSNNNERNMSSKLNPSGQSNKGQQNKEGFRGAMQTKVASGTADRPIDIETLLFHNHTPKSQNKKKDFGHRCSENSEMISSVE